ncbi:MAG: hypothetical protein R3A13_02380 [Bdellovibrionota bacterium]
MTAAGIACLAIVKEALVVSGKLEPRDPKDQAKLKPIDDGINSGWAKLGEIFDVKTNPGNPGWHYYWLYGLERVGAFLGVPNMGKHKWYPVGAKYLVEQQLKQEAGKPENPEAGSWAAGGHESQLVRTCFALLFLKRSTKPPAVPIMPPVTTD